MGTHSRRSGRRRPAVVALTALLVVAGGLAVAHHRGHGATPSTSTTTTAGPTTTTTIGVMSTRCAPPAASVNGLPRIQCPSPAATWGLAPIMVIPRTPPPTSLEVANLITGKGPAAKKGDRLIVEYELGTYSTHRVVQSSRLYTIYTPITLYLGQNQVPGWDQGLLGVRAGGRREIIVPPTKGYGATSPAPGIAKNDTLVYIVDVYNIN